MSLDFTTNSIQLRWTDDGGHNYANRVITNLPKTGEYGYRVRFTRLGSTRRNSGLDRVFEISSDSIVNLVVIGAYLGD